MREVVLDTETTGLSPDDGDRIVEIGCVELLNHLPTGEEFHTYINPGMTMPESAFKIHGLSDEFLRDKPGISDVLDAFLDFLGSSTLVIHNAEFDLKFQTDLKLINDVTHVTPSKKNNRVERVYDITTEEKREHEKFLEKIKNPIWLN